MKTITALGALTIGSLGLMAACDKSAAERQEEAVEERAEAREELREEAAQPRISPNVAEQTNEPSTNAATAKKGIDAASVKQIADARCAREQKCGNVGADKDYASAQACHKEVTEDWNDELNAYDCPGGVVQKELSECLEEIENEDCKAPFDTLGRIVACRSSDICKALD